MINTNSVINQIKTNIKNTIDLEQQKLNSIEISYKKAEEFLFENNFSEVDKNEDVIIGIMNCIKLMKKQMNDNIEDILSIENSLAALETLTNSIDPNILKGLKEKISNIQSFNETTQNKLKESNSFLEILLALEIICPVCNGNGRIDARDNSTYSMSKCDYCHGVGVINIAKILKNENKLEVEISTEIKGIYHDGLGNKYNIEKDSYLPNNEPRKTINCNENENKFIITKNNIEKNR